MVENILTSTVKQQSMTIARMKVGAPSAPLQDTGLTGAESRLADILDIGAAVKDRAEKTRRLDGYLRFFQSVIQFVNGATSNSALRPQISPVHIEYVKLDNPYAPKMDKTI